MQLLKMLIKHLLTKKMFILLWQRKNSNWCIQQDINYTYSLKGAVFLCEDLGTEKK